METSAVFRLPAEIWQAIFQEFTTHDLHIFDQSGYYRRGITRRVQTLQLVCRTWHVSKRQLSS